MWSIVNDVKKFISELTLANVEIPPNTIKFVNIEDDIICDFTDIRFSQIHRVIRLCEEGKATIIYKE